MNYLDYSSILPLIWWYILYVNLGGAYIFTNFAVSHTHLPTVPKDDRTKTWVHYSCEHTMNVGLDNPLVTWWMSYLNYQIEHHLFPSMPQFRFAKKEVSGRVRELFEKHGFQYLEMGYFDAVKVTLDNLDQVAKDAMEEYGGGEEEGEYETYEYE